MTIGQILTYILFLTPSKTSSLVPIKCINQFENLIIPFKLSNSFCHVHVIISPEVFIHFSQSLSITEYTTFTIGYINTLNITSEQLINNTFDFAPKIKSKNISVILANDFDKNVSETEFLSIKPATSTKCVLFIVLFFDEYQTGKYTNGVNFIYAQLEAAFQAIKQFYIVGDKFLSQEPSNYSVLHVTTLETDSYFESLSCELRSVLQTILEFKTLFTWIINLNTSKHYHKLKTFDVPQIFNATFILTFCYYCAPAYQTNKFKEASRRTGKYDWVKLGNLNKLSAKMGQPKFWSVQYYDFSDTARIKDYNDQKNVFRVPTGNKLIFRFTIVSILLNYANASLVSNYCFQNSWNFKNCNESFEGAYPEVVPETRTTVHFPEYLVFYAGHIRKSGYNFLTCYYYNYRSWQYYLEPFQLELWIVLISYLTLLAIYLHVTLVVRNQYKSNFSPYFFVYSTMLEYAYGVFSYIFELPTMQILIGMWLLLSCIFTNAYKGIAITGVTAPKSKSSINSFFDIYPYQTLSTDQFQFQDTYEFQVFTDLSPNDLDAWKTWNSSKMFNKYTEGSKQSINYSSLNILPAPVQLSAIMESGHLFFSRHKHNFTKQHYETYWEKLQLLFNLGQLNMYQVPRPDNRSKYAAIYDIAIEREITNSSKKIIYVSDEIKIKSDFEYYSRHYYYKKFFKGKESILMEPVLWEFENPRGSKLVYYFKKLLESGIYSQIKWFYNRQVYSGLRLEYTRSAVEKTHKLVRPLDLNSNLQTIFYVFLIGNAVSVFIIVNEINHTVNLIKFILLCFRSFLVSILNAIICKCKRLFKCLKMSKIVKYMYWIIYYIRGIFSKKHQ